MFESILSDFFSVNTLKSVSTSIIVSASIIHIYIKYFADKSIEYYKKEFQKELHDYNLYAVKRNSTYQEMYELMQKTFGSFPAIEGKLNYPIFTDSAADNLLILQKLFPDQKFQEFTNKGYSYDIWCNKKIVKSITEYNNARLLNSLYFTDKIDKALLDIFNEFTELLNCTPTFLKSGDLNNYQSLHLKIKLSIQELRTKLRSEIF